MPVYHVEHPQQGHQDKIFLQHSFVKATAQDGTELPVVNVVGSAPKVEIPKVAIYMGWSTSEALDVEPSVKDFEEVEASFSIGLVDNATASAEDVVANTKVLHLSFNEMLGEAIAQEVAMVVVMGTPVRETKGIARSADVSVPTS